MRVRIYRPSKTASQSGRAKTHAWLVEPELATARRPDDLMGWQQAGDTLGELAGQLKFTSREAAVRFAADRGWEAVIEEPAERRVTPRNYLDNFRITRPEDEERQGD